VISDRAVTIAVTKREASQFEQQKVDEEAELERLQVAHKDLPPPPPAMLL